MEYSVEAVSNSKIVDGLGIYGEIGSWGERATAQKRLNPIPD
jgi:hypothetical protein